MRRKSVFMDKCLNCEGNHTSIADQEKKHGEKTATADPIKKL